MKEEPYLKFFFSTPPASGNHAAILFDRDGVINERVIGGYVTEWKHFRFRDGIIQAMTALAKLALPMVVISNQAGVGKCLMSSRTLEDITERFVSVLKECHVTIDAVYYCPHTPEQNCGCRKPRPGLMEAAARDWKLDLRRSVLIADSETDLEAARKVNCHAVFVSSDGDASARTVENQYPGWDVSTVRDGSELAAAVYRFFPKLQK